MELLNFVQEVPSGSHGVETLLDICCFADHDARKACAFPAAAGAVKFLDGIKSIKNHAAWVKRQIKVGNVTTACSQFKLAAVPAILRCLNAESFGCCLSLDWFPEHELPQSEQGVPPTGLGDVELASQCRRVAVRIGRVQDAPRWHCVCNWRALQSSAW